MCHHGVPPPNHVLTTGCPLSHHAMPGPGPGGGLPQGGSGPGPPQQCGGIGVGGGLPPPLPGVGPQPVPPVPPPPLQQQGGGGHSMQQGCPGVGLMHSGMGTLAHGPSLVSLHQLPPPTLCNPCSSNTNNFNSVPLPGPSSVSRWGPRSSCPVHSPYRIRVPNGNVCSGHQVSK